MKVWTLIYRDDYPFEAWSSEERAVERAREMGESTAKSLGAFRPGFFARELSRERIIEQYAPAVIELALDAPAEEGS